MNIPNALSLFRIFLAALFTVFMTLDYSWSMPAALICFLLAAITDWLDGYLARKLNLVTDLGKLLDPLADKILVAAAFVLFTEKAICPSWITITILFREFAVTGLRLLLVEKGTVLPADNWGKWKTATQMIYCLMVLVTLSFNLESIQSFTVIILYISLALTVISGTNYMVRGVKQLQ